MPHGNTTLLTWTVVSAVLISSLVAVVAATFPTSGGSRVAPTRLAFAQTVQFQPRNRLPDEAVQYSQVPKAPKVFTATTIPSGLLKDHSTKAGTWGVIHVQKGQLEYTITGEKETPSYTLSPTVHGIIEPQVLHHVKALTDDVEFVVKFYRQPGTGPVNEQREGL